MKHRTAVRTVAVLWLAAAVANAGSPAKEQKKTKPAPCVESQQVTAAVPLTELFARPADQSIHGEHGMVMIDQPVTSVMLVRRNDDGSISHACVTTEKAARAFLEQKNAAAGHQVK